MKFFQGPYCSDAFVIFRQGFPFARHSLAEFCYQALMGLLDETEFYRRLHTGNPGDCQFYCRVARGAKSVLELGCGWGRVAEELLRAGHPLTGVDINEAFLRMARSSLGQYDKTRFVQADLRDFELSAGSSPEKFDRIIVAYNTLYSLGGTAGVAACFAQIAKHLSEEGELWFDVYPMDELHAALEAGDDTQDNEDDPVAIFSLNSQELHVYESTQIHHQEKKVSVTYRALDKEQQEVATLEMEHCYLTLEDLTGLLEGAGLCLFGGFGSFQGAPLDEQAEQLILGARHTPGNNVSL